jgi:hypothetical protein
MKNREKGGIVLWIALVIVGLGLLKYFLNWDIFDAAASEQGQSTISYVRQVVDSIWSVIGYPVTVAWNEVIHPVFTLAWNNLKAIIEWGMESAGNAKGAPMYSGSLN